MRVVRLNKYLVKINRLISYMPPERYTQWCSFSHDNTRVYVDRGVAGGLSISVKNVTVLAQSIEFVND